MNRQKGYVLPIVFVVFALIIGIMIFPMKYPSLAEPEPCFIGDPPDASETILNLNAIKEAPPGEGQTHPMSGGADPDVRSNFVMLRKNVPILKSTLENNDPRPDYPPHTSVFGEVPEKPGYDLHYPVWTVAKLKKGDSYPLPKEGVVLFIKKDDPSIDSDNLFLIADIYQDEKYLTGRGLDSSALFECSNQVILESTQVISPEQEGSKTKEQLQLEWFMFDEGKYWQLHCKPAVYLYPQRKQLVNVKVFPKGELGYTDPPYPKGKGWTVEANPDGSLYQGLSSKYHASQKIDYLYYESKLLDSEFKKPERGWVVRPSEMEQLLSEVLPKLGLNKKEQKDFMDYWLSKLPDSPYYFVGLVEKEQRDYLETLSVTPTPDTSIRFSLLFEMLDEPVPVEEPDIKTPVRNGFTLVDWGGMIKLHPGTPFTCSQ